MIRRTSALPILHFNKLCAARTFHYSVIAGRDLAGSRSLKQDKDSLLSVKGIVIGGVGFAMSSDDYKHKLTEESYEVCWKKGTEPPFSGKYYDHFENGIYVCICCRTPLFSSKSKYQSGCGWPSFSLALNDENGDTTITREKDTSLNRIRTEVLCKKCGSHLGHVFPDGPPPTGERYCINSLSLDFTSD